MCIVNIKSGWIETRVILRQYQMKTNVIWIIEIYQVDYLWVKSQANICLRGVWKLGTFNFLTIYSTVTTWKGQRKCQRRVMEKSLNFILGFLYEPCVKDSHYMGQVYIGGLVQDCSNSSALAMELLQSCTKPSIWCWRQLLLDYNVCQKLLHGAAKW